MSLGKYPDVPLALARERHAEARKLLATGVDPMAQRKAEKTAEKIAVENSFQSTTTQWLEHWQEEKSPRHVDSVRRRMAADISPCLGPRPIAEIEAPELVAMANAIQDRGARDIAKRALVAGDLPPVSVDKVQSAVLSNNNRASSSAKWNNFDWRRWRTRRSFHVKRRMRL
jgi:hypothetical protein